MTVTTRRERRQQQRQQERRSSGGGGGGRSGGISQVWIVVGVVAIAVALILVARATGVFDAPASTGFDINDAKFNTGGQAIGEHKDEVSKFHVASGQKVDFPSLPPTSGDHWAAPAAPAPWGVKTSWLPFEVTVHNLEHGGIVILYGPDVTSEQVNTLRLYVRQLQSSGFPKIILEPWPDMPKDSKIILTAWNWIMNLPGVDQVSIVKFTKAHHASSEAPEPNVP
jgi:uncharacterized protein DUF3105